MNKQRVFLAAIGPVSVVAGLGVLPAFQQVRVETRQPLPTAEQARILAHMSIVDLDDGQGGTVPTLRISGINVQIVNGLGATNGNPAFPKDTQESNTSTNGLGNLILAYNEFGNLRGDAPVGPSDA